MIIIRIVRSSSFSSQFQFQFAVPVPVCSSSSQRRIINDRNHLRELFYDRNPGDARVKVGSERKFASSPVAPSFGVGEIGVNDVGFCPRGPSKIGPVIKECTPKKNPILRWDFSLKSYSLSHSGQIWSQNRTHSRILAPRGRQNARVSSTFTPKIAEMRE